ncbi:hypothetical protein BJ508DRAFT_418235 [Ascobolus immersus RN42]|uniref:Uncharacterized protein n=1 Tax=Ascobolus immersus RN42 TaxID=1160509 RepID=A0A3N4HTX4_ASCIM|nr:hypothetical protein BJ508DRAFT_418235 [Ascobolus immersus RN42]
MESDTPVMPEERCLPTESRNFEDASVEEMLDATQQNDVIASSEKLDEDDESGLDRDELERADSSSSDEEAPVTVYYHSDLKEVRIRINQTLIKPSRYFKECYLAVTQLPWRGKTISIFRNVFQLLFGDDGSFFVAGLPFDRYDSKTMDTGYFLMALEGNNTLLDCDEIEKWEETKEEWFSSCRQDEKLDDVLFATCINGSSRIRFLLLNIDPGIERGGPESRRLFQHKTLLAAMNHYEDHTRPLSGAGPVISRTLIKQQRSQDAHLGCLWIGLLDKSSWDARKMATFDYGVISFLRLIGFGYSTAAVNFESLKKVKPVWESIRDDKDYPEERFKLLLFLWGQLFTVLEEWALQREIVVKQLRHLESIYGGMAGRDKQDELIGGLISWYITDPDAKFQEHIERILLFCSVIVFLGDARAPSVDERIWRYLFEVAE